MFSKIKQMIKYTDMFYSSEMLRHEDEQQYRTVTGGILSIAIIITTIVGFASMILDTLDLSTITTSTLITKNNDPTYSTFTTSPQQNFMFGVQIWPHITQDSQRYFDVTLNQEISAGQSFNNTKLTLQPCTREHWSLLPNHNEKYDSLNMAKWLCPPIGQAFEIYGKYSSKGASMYVLQVSGCNNETDPSRPCASQQKIDELFVNYQQRLFFTLYFTNPIINPNQKTYKSYYLQEQNYVAFGSSIGSQLNLFFTDYTINTDYSIWPFKDISVDQGLIVQAVPVNHPYQTVQNGVYARMSLAKSPNSIIYNRQVQKISSVFSFIGGMISAASALFFFIKVYTNLSYQISIANSIFQRSDKDEQSPLQPLRMNFFTFLSYHFYHTCKKVGIKLQWPKIDYLSKCQAEIAKQLDIKVMIKRFIFIQHCLTHIFQDFQLDQLQAKSPSSVQQIRLIRQKCQCSTDEDKSKKSQASHSSNNKQIRDDRKYSNPKPKCQRKNAHPILEQISDQIIFESSKKGDIVGRNSIESVNFSCNQNIGNLSITNRIRDINLFHNLDYLQSRNDKKRRGDLEEQLKKNGFQDTHNRLIISEISQIQKIR